MRTGADKATTERVVSLLHDEAVQDPGGSVTATFVSRALGITGDVAIDALKKVVRRNLVRVVYHDVCERGHVNNNVIEDKKTGVGFCPECNSDRPHDRYVVYRFEPRLREITDPKAARRRAPQLSLQA
jgi:hypothetical protein